jgi:hypothetical protein
MTPEIFFLYVRPTLPLIHNPRCALEVVTISKNNPALAICPCERVHIIEHSDIRSKGGTASLRTTLD